MARSIDSGVQARRRSRRCRSVRTAWSEWSPLSSPPSCATRDLAIPCPRLRAAACPRPQAPGETFERKDAAQQLADDRQATSWWGPSRFPGLLRGSSTVRRRLPHVRKRPAHDSVGPSRDTVAVPSGQSALAGQPAHLPDGGSLRHICARCPHGGCCASGERTFARGGTRGRDIGGRVEPSCCPSPCCAPAHFVGGRAGSDHHRSGRLWGS